MKLNHPTNKVISCILILGIVVGCSTAAKSSFYGGLVGSILGGSLGLIAGQHFSPQGKFNQAANGTLGATIGVATGAWMGSWAGKYFYGENPENRELKQMLVPENTTPSIDLGFGSQEIKLNAVMEPSKKYKIPTENIPDEIRKKMRSPIVIEHKVKEQYIELPGHQGLYVPEFKVMEQTFEDKADE